MNTLSVLTYNLYYGKALNHLKEILKLYNPDIIGLQEVQEKPNLKNVFIPLGYELTSYVYSFQKFKKNFNIATLYKKDSISLSYSNYLNLPRSIYEFFLKFLKKSPLPRNFTFSYFEKNKKSFLHINLHLSPWSTDGAKVKQIKKVFNSISKEKMPVIITGDFNYPYGRRRFEFLLREYTIEEATRNIPFTMETKILKIFPLRMKLDYILYKNIKFINIKRISKKSSDHYPIIAKFKI